MYACIYLCYCFVFFPFICVTHFVSLYFYLVVNLNTKRVSQCMNSPDINVVFDDEIRAAAKCILLYRQADEDALTDSFVGMYMYEYMCMYEYMYMYMYMYMYEYMYEYMYTYMYMYV